MPQIVFTCANPGPVGLFGFATTTFALSIVNTGLVDGTAAFFVAAMALFHGGTVQLLGGLWELYVGNIFAATAFCSYGGFWLSYGFFVTKLIDNVPSDGLSDAVGLFLLCWTFATFFLLIVSWKTTWPLFALFVFLETTFIILTIGNFGNEPDLVKAGGYLGIITAFIAYYIAFGELMNTLWKRKIIFGVPYEKKFL